MYVCTHVKRTGTQIIATLQSRAIIFSYVYHRNYISTFFLIFFFPVPVHMHAFPSSSAFSGASDGLVRQSERTRTEKCSLSGLFAAQRYYSCNLLVSVEAKFPYLFVPYTVTVMIDSPPVIGFLMEIGLADARTFPRK